jgi:predicted DNA-binding transcriptional regulator YafY
MEESQEDKTKKKFVKAQPTKENVLKLLVYLLEAEKPVKMVSLERLFGGGFESEKDKSRTVFRYLKVLEDWGFELIRGDHYSIKKKANYREIQLSSSEAQALYFSAQEIPNSELRSTTQEKLLRIYHESRSKEELIDKRSLALIEWCEKHINKAKVKFQMILKNYTSINSGKIKDRLVVPLVFNNEAVEIYAYDLHDNGALKVFKLDRMDGIEKLKEKAPKELNLGKLEIKRDPFGYLIHPDRQLLKLDLRMDLKAFVLFSLHFSKLVPMIERLDEPENKMPYRIELELLRVEALAGWMIGLINHIEFVDSSEFKAALKSHFDDHIIKELQTKLNS